jgi:hypothetical protein
MSAPTKRPKSVSEYLSVFEQLTKSWSTSPSEEIQVWCRGQGDAKWSLVPGEYRSTQYVPADEIRSEFQLKARPLLAMPPQSEWEWYFIMQHHGLPTRLLDWTRGSLTGLYFALRDNEGDRDAAVWVLDPWQLNKESIGSAEIVFSHERQAQKYLPKLFSVKEKLPLKPIAIVPPYNTERITVQRGTFTVHGRKRTGLEEMFKSRLVKIIIPKDSIGEMRRTLRRSGITEFTVFPDLDGLGRDISSVYIEGF